MLLVWVNRKEGWWVWVSLHRCWFCKFFPPAQVCCKGVPSRRRGHRWSSGRFEWASWQQESVSLCSDQNCFDLWIYSMTAPSPWPIDPCDRWQFLDHIFTPPTASWVWGRGGGLERAATQDHIFECHTSFRQIFFLAIIWDDWSDVFHGCVAKPAWHLVSIHILLALNLEIFIMTGGKWKRWDVVLMGTDGHKHLDLHFLFTTFGGKRSGLGWRLCSRLWLVWARSAWVKASNDETGHKVNSNEVPMKGCGWKVEPGSCASWKG